MVKKSATKQAANKVGRVAKKSPTVGARIIEGLEQAITRCQLFMEAGADMAKPMGVDTVADIKRVLREVEGPHMATLSQAAGPKARSLAELEAAEYAPRPSRRSRCLRRRRRCATCLACSNAKTRSLPASRTCSRSTTITGSWA